MVLKPAVLVVVDNGTNVPVQMFPYADILFDQEAEGSGVYMPYLQEPEHCHANSAVLWELHALRVGVLVFVFQQLVCGCVRSKHPTQPMLQHFFCHDALCPQKP